MALFSAVITTGIYCCPGACSGRPREHNRRWYASAAAAEADGYRACHQCRPYRTQPGWRLEAPELVCRALRLVLDGALDGQGTEAELAAGVGASARHLRRLFLEYVGVTPVALARSSRAHFARRLLDDTDLSITEIAEVAAFGSVRQFNKVMQATFRATPSELRAKRRRADRLVADGGLTVRVPYEPPLDVDRLLAELAAQAIPGVEAVGEGCFRRIISVARDPAVLEVRPGDGAHLLVTVHLPHWEGLLHLVQRVRRLFSLDDDPAAGRHARAWDGFEVAVGEILAAPCGGERGHDPRDALAALVRSTGQPVDGMAPWGLTHRFPDPATLATITAGDVADLPLSAVTAGRLRALAQATAAGDIILDGTLSPGDLRDRLRACQPLAPLADALSCAVDTRLGLSG